MNYLGEKMKQGCPSCKKEVEYIEFECNAPFTAPAELALQALTVWGAYSAPKEQICHSLTDSGDFVHFRFLGDGSERLVKMLGFDRQKYVAKQEQIRSLKKPCEHRDENDKPICSKEGNPIFSAFQPDEPLGYYCDEHCFENGACPGCYEFLAGWESFDFSESGYCDGCMDDFRESFDDDDDRDYEDYHSAW